MSPNASQRDDQRSDEAEQPIGSAHDTPTVVPDTAGPASDDPWATHVPMEAYQGNAKNLVLGNYTILDQIGQGGMGQVFKAQHRRMDRIVAIKMLPSAVTKDKAAVARFEREVKAAAKLNHPNIVTAYDADEAAGRHFLVMEFVEGQDLSAVVRKDGPLAVDQAVSCIIQTARGLEYAHRRGVVHRDIKPANLLLDLEGTVKILDMGLARLESAVGVEHAELTGTGQIMGTIDYMSPEQALDTKHANERSDIYSLGCTLWYLLTGRAAYSGESVMAKLLAHREQPIPSLQVACPGVTPDLEGVFKKMVAKKAEDRFQSMSEVVAELERCQTGAAPTPSTGPSADEDTRLQDFRLSGGNRPAPVVATKAAPKKIASSTAMEATVAFQSPQVDTDPKTQQSLAGPLAVRTRKPRQASFPWHPGRNTWLAAGGGASLLLAAIVFYVHMKDVVIRVEINDPQIEVAIKGTEIVLKQADNGHDIKLSPGEKTLVVERGDFKFETDKLILKKGETVAVAVTLVAGQVEVKQGDKVIGHAKLPAAWHGWPADAPKPAIAPFDAVQAKKHQQEWARYLGVPAEWTNSIGMKFVLIPPGEFEMGSSNEEVRILYDRIQKDWPYFARFLADETPRHHVMLTQPFYLGAHEVTQANYQTIRGVNPSAFAADSDYPQFAERVKGVDTASHPVECVSWLDSVEFCAGLNARDNIARQDSRGYSLPSEAQWEFACRAGTTTQFFTGEGEDSLGEKIWYGFTSGGQTLPVGESTPNALGLFDMQGNVSELVSDVYTRDAYQAFTKSPAINPKGSSSNDPSALRFNRGGYWNSQLFTLRSAFRAGGGDGAGTFSTGFRVAVSVDAVQQILHRKKTPSPAKSWHGWPFDAPKSAIAPFNTEQAREHQEAWAKHLGAEVEIENSLGMKLRLIPPGEFMMGSPQEEIDALVQSTTDQAWQFWNRSEGPQHRVKLTQAFYLGTCEVTQKQYRELMGVNPSHFSLTGPGKDVMQDVETNHHPVELASWFDAIDFCNKLSEKEQRPPYHVRNGEVVNVLGGTGYRLPTEAEWEYACRAGTTTRWCFGDNEQDLPKHAWFDSNAGGRTHRVEGLLANPFGLYDMHGNIWEWCSDWHGEYAAGPVSDPTVAKTGSGRVDRGGGWSFVAAGCRSAGRSSSQPTYRASDLGFRVAAGPFSQASKPTREAASEGREGP